MARVAKIDNAVKKRFDREEKKRSVDIRNERKYFLIICEGARTEPAYFKALEMELPPGTIDLKIVTPGGNTIGLVKYAIRQREQQFGRKYDQVWAVFDKDEFPDEHFNNAITLAFASDIQCAWSNAAFELWFLLHFHHLEAGISHNQYPERLEHQIRIASGNNAYTYNKSDPNIYSTLKRYGSQAKAIERAKKLKARFSDQRYATHNPCTCVHELIEALMAVSTRLPEL